MARRAGVEVVAFDVNETLSDMAPMARRFSPTSGRRRLAALWFASVLRDGFALTAAGAKKRFAALADAALRTHGLHGVVLTMPVDEAVAHVLAGFSQLPVHPDVPDAVRALRARGLRLVTLSNGAVQVAEGLLERSGLRGEFEQLLSVDGAPAWKPHPRSYAYALRSGAGWRPRAPVLVAAHPWDVDGAARAGLVTAFVDRTGAPYPSWARPPDHTVTALTDLARVLA